VLITRRLTGVTLHDISCGLKGMRKPVLLMVLGVQVGSVGLLGEIVIFTHTRKMRDYAIKGVPR
jgi:hypothetical protein